MTSKPSFNKTALALAMAQALVINMSSAATITVDQVIDSANIGCSLREAIRNVNAGSIISGSPCSTNIVGQLGINDTILFSVTSNTRTLTPIQITSDIAINPGGTPIIINGDGMDGVLDIRNANVSLDNATITGGASGITVLSGGINIENSTVTLVNSTVSANEGAVGGGVYVADSTLMLLDSTISGNSAYTAGGIYGTSSNIEIRNSTVSSNTAGGYGGGIYDYSSIIELSNSTISGNSATYGGGVYAVSSTMTLSNTTLTNNSAIEYGGGVSVVSSAVTFNNTIVAGNLSDVSAAEVYNIESTIVLDTNLFGNGANAFYDFVPSASDITVNLDQLSLASVLSPLANNGGPTLTHALPNGSPAINTANNLVCAVAPVSNLDQRGQPRPFAEVCDIGSYELQAVNEENDSQFFVIPLPDDGAVIFGL